MAVNKRTRYEVLRRDNHACRYCGAKAPEVSLTVDHVLPVSLGGTDKPDNLVAACRDCNAGKAASNPDAPLVADVRQDAIRWAQAVQVVVGARMAERVERDGYTDGFDAGWSSWTWGGEKQYPIPRPSDWKQTIWRFYALGLPWEDLEEAMDIACGSTRVNVDGVWRYFCGVCWRRLEEIAEAARAVIEAEEAD